MILAAGMLAAGTGAHAEELVISEVSVDYESSTLLIIGSGLLAGAGPLRVTLGEDDISAHCVPGDPEARPQAVVCDRLDLPVTRT